MVQSVPFAVTAPVSPIVTTLALTANVPSPQVLGNTVSWLAAATGGVAPYQFQWTLVRWEYDSPPLVNRLDLVVDTCDHGQLPGTSGRTECGKQQLRRRNGPVGAICSDGPSGLSDSPAQSAGATKSRHHDPLVGCCVWWWSGVRYWWWVLNGSVWSSMSGWTTNSTWSWRPTSAKPGYVVRVWVRASGSTIDRPRRLLRSVRNQTRATWYSPCP